MKANLTSLENKVNHYAKAFGGKTNGYAWHEMQNAVESIVDDVEARQLLSHNEFLAIIDKHTFGKFKNPENCAIRAEANEELKIAGYVINTINVFKVN